MQGNQSERNEGILELSSDDVDMVSGGVFYLGGYCSADGTSTASYNLGLGGSTMVMYFVVY